MSNVVAFPVAERSCFDEAWALVPVTMRRRSCKVALLRDLWDRHARAFGQKELAGALRAYVTDKDFDRHGGQALDRWLKAGRYEHFTPAPPPALADQFSDPMVRRAVATRLGEDFARIYLDPCQVEGTTLLVRTLYAADKMKEHAVLFRSLGFTGMRKMTTEKISPSTGTKLEH